MQAEDNSFFTDTLGSNEAQLEQLSSAYAQNQV